MKDTELVRRDESQTGGGQPHGLVTVNPVKSDRPEVVVFDGDVETATRFADAFCEAGLRVFKAAQMPLRDIVAAPGFDALYWPLPAAERWNVRPIEDVIQVIRTSDADRAEGWPDLMLVGLALSPESSNGVERGFRTWARALLEALRRSGPEMVRVKVPSEVIRLSELAPNRAAAILADVEREYFGDPDSSPGDR